MKIPRRPVGLFLFLAACGSSPSSRSSPSSIECGETTGRNESIDVGGLSGLVHLPPCYDSTDGEYPTVYLLHGAGMTPRSWTDASIDADEAADRLMVNGEIAPVVLVFAPRSTTGRAFADRVLEPLLDIVERDHRVLETADSRAIGGFSAAGPATAFSAFSGPARFGAVGFFAVTWSADTGADLVESMASRSDRPAALIDVGERDNLRANVERIESDLATIGVEPEVTIVAGRHDFAFVADRIDDWLIWFDLQQR